MISQWLANASTADPSAQNTPSRSPTGRRSKSQIARETPGICQLDLQDHRQDWPGDWASRCNVIGGPILITQGVMAGRIRNIIETAATRSFGALGSVPHRGISSSADRWLVCLNRFAWRREGNAKASLVFFGCCGIKLGWIKVNEAYLEAKLFEYRVQGRERRVTAINLKL